MTEIVLFGVTGDLSKNKLLPSLVRVSGYKDLKIIGFGRKPFTKRQFVDFVTESALQQGVILNKDLNRIEFEYIQSELDDIEGFKKLDTKLSKEAFLFLAIPPALQLPVSKLAIQAGLIDKKNNRRLVFEKPFGTNTKEAEKLNTFLVSKIRQDQVLRTDHYAGKETLLDLERAGRIGMPAFISSTETIKTVEVRFREKITADMRGSFYDSVGALADVGQNHMMHMLITFLASFGESCVYHDEGASTCVISSSVSPELQHIRSILAASLRHTGKPFLGQYRGFRDVPGVQKSSKTETYFSFELDLLNPKAQIKKLKLRGETISENALNSVLRICNIFKNTKIIFSAGKALDKHDVSITMQLKKSAYKLMISKTCGKDAYDEIFTALTEENWNRFVSFDQVLSGWRIIESVKRKAPKKPVEYSVGTLPHA